MTDGGPADGALVSREASARRPPGAAGAASTRLRRYAPSGPRRGPLVRDEPAGFRRAAVRPGPRPAARRAPPTARPVRRRDRPARGARLVVVRLRRRPRPIVPATAALRRRPAGSGTAARRRPTTARHAPTPSTPPRPSRPGPPGVWDRLRPAADGRRRRRDRRPAAAVGRPPPTQPPSRAARGERFAPSEDHADDDDAHRRAPGLDPDAWEDQTGGLEVIGAHVEDDAAAAAVAAAGAPPSADRHGARDAGTADAARTHDGLPTVTTRRPRRPRLRRGHPGQALRPADRPRAPAPPPGRGRRSRCSSWPAWSSASSLGGQKLLELINPTAQDYTGQGSGEVADPGAGRRHPQRHRPHAGRRPTSSPRSARSSMRRRPTRTAIGIQPGVYGMRQQMSGQAALTCCSTRPSRLLSRVTVPEGLTVERTLARIAEETGLPVEEYAGRRRRPRGAGPAGVRQRAARGLPLPGDLRRRARHGAGRDAPADGRAGRRRCSTELQIPEADRLPVVTKASMVQAEAGSVEDMGKVARVLENRLADGMPLQLDTTVNYANGKGGITTTADGPGQPLAVQHLRPPGAAAGRDQQPGGGRAARRAGPDAGSTGGTSWWSTPTPATPGSRRPRPSTTQNVQLFRQWLRENPEG